MTKSSDKSRAYGLGWKNSVAIARWRRWEGEVGEGKKEVKGKTAVILSDITGWRTK